MRLVPESNEGKVGFYRTHLGAWAEHAGAIGLSEDRVEQLQAILAEAETALRTQRQAQQAAQTATQAATNAVEKLSRIGAGVLNVIRAEGLQSGSEVFNLAMIPAPSRKKTTLGPPTAPGDFSAELIATGWLKITWKCRSPRGAGGTIYKVSRQLDGAGPFVELDLIGKKTFTDKTIPPGTTSVTYQVEPRRSTCVGEVGRYTVNLACNFVLPEFEVGKQAA